MFLLFIRGTPCKVLRLHFVSYPPHNLNAKFQDGLLNAYHIIKPLKNVSNRVSLIAWCKYRGKR